MTCLCYTFESTSAIHPAASAIFVWQALGNFATVMANVIEEMVGTSEEEAAPVATESGGSVATESGGDRVRRGSDNRRCDGW